MLVTALTPAPHIGYDRAAEIAKLAHHGRQHAEADGTGAGLVSEADFNAGCGQPG